MAIHIDHARCTGCGVCVDICPEDVLHVEEAKVAAKYPEECWYCGSCVYDCPHEAIEVAFGIHLGPKFIRT